MVYREVTGVDKIKCLQTLSHLVCCRHLKDSNYFNNIIFLLTEEKSLFMI